MNNDFAVFILSHGRGDNVKTYKMLKRQGYTGKIFIVIDDEDEDEKKYFDNFENVIVFNKQKYIDSSDSFTNENYRKTVLYARNAAFDIADQLRLKYFLCLDDDYCRIDFRYEDEYKLKAKLAMNLDRVFNDFIEFLETSGAYTVTMAQAGDFIGGAQGTRYREKFLRKAMNSFFCKTDRKFMFLGAMNDDVNTYVINGQIGNIFCTITQISIVQEMTQSQKGGLTDMYIEKGTCSKSFHSVMCAPSCTKISIMNTTNKRIHHNIFWDNCAVKIINEKYKK